MTDFDQPFNGKVRVRVCGILIENDAILLLKHLGFGLKGVLWLPPGGGISFGEPMEDALIREFKEETGLTVRVDEYLYLHEYISDRLHSIEVFFRVTRLAGEASLGTDPEFTEDGQILKDLRYFTESDIKNMDIDLLHYSFKLVHSPFDILQLRGFSKFENISK